jgi:tetratricopeptide (TPR) repeat protein
MPLRNSALYVLLLASSVQLRAQYDASEPAQTGRQTTPASMGILRAVPVSIRFMLEDGAQITTAPQVGTDCHVTGVFYKGANGVIKLESRDPGGVNPEGGSARPPTIFCFVRVMLPGYQTALSIVHGNSEIVLKRLGEHEGSSVSLTTLSAPENAQRAYSKGEASAAKRKWADAAKHFEEAVALYPAYATAWSELGTALQEQERFEDAQNALNKAIATDPKYLKAVVQLAELDGRRERWDEELHDAQRAVDLHPVAYPSVYYFQAEAEYHLNHPAEAERLCRTAIDSDLGGEVPQAHLLLGNLLANAGRPAEAIEEFRVCEKLDRQGRYGSLAKQRIRELGR